MRVVTTSVGPDSDWSEVVSELNAFDGLANGVTLIVAPGCPVEVCHELALALASDALCQRGLLVATSLPMPPSDGPATREAVELVLMSATGMSVDLLAKQILSISSPRQEGRDLKYEVGVIRI